MKIILTLSLIISSSLSYALTKEERLLRESKRLEAKEARLIERQQTFQQVTQTTDNTVVQEQMTAQTETVEASITETTSEQAALETEINGTLCTAPQVYDTSSNSCIDCVAGTIFNSANNLCEPIVCQEGFELHLESNTCQPIVTCDTGYVYDEPSNSCHIVCGEGYIRNAELNQCVLKSVCATGEIFDPVNNLCGECGAKTKLNKITNQCEKAFDEIYLGWPYSTPAGGPYYETPLSKSLPTAEALSLVNSGDLRTVPDYYFKSGVMPLSPTISIYADNSVYATDFNGVILYNNVCRASFQWGGTLSNGAPATQTGPVELYADTGEQLTFNNVEDDGYLCKNIAKFIYKVDSVKIIQSSTNSAFQLIVPSTFN